MAAVLETVEEGKLVEHDLGEGGASDLRGAGELGMLAQCSLMEEEMYS